MLTVLDLFSGIGGFSLGLERTGGFQTVAFCETDNYCRRVLAKHWPDIPIYGDVRELNGDAIPAAAVICGGPPCQHTSVVAAIHGRRTGTTLWPEMFRIASECSPKWLVVEQPPGNKRWEAALQRDLAGAGWQVSRYVRSAAGVGAPHLRWRVFFVANRHGARLAFPGEAGPPPLGAQQRAPAQRDPWLPDNAGAVRVDDGFPRGLDRLERNARIHAIGSAVVPQVVEVIGRAILAAEADMRSAA